MEYSRWVIEVGTYVGEESSASFNHTHFLSHSSNYFDENVLYKLLICDCGLSRTIFPNTLGHRSRLEAESGAEYLLLSVIHGLLNGECSPEIRLLGCAVLASPCKDDKMIKPCRSTCEALRKDCSHAFEAIEMAWPYFLDCDRFFASNREGCFDPLAGMKGKAHSLCTNSHPMHSQKNIALSSPSLYRSLLQPGKSKQCPASLPKNPVPSSSSPTPPMPRCTAY